MPLARLRRGPIETGRFPPSGRAMAFSGQFWFGISWAQFGRYYLSGRTAAITQTRDAFPAPLLVQCSP